MILGAACQEIILYAHAVYDTGKQEGKERDGAPSVLCHLRVSCSAGLGL